MIPFFIGAIIGGFVGLMATACCVAASERDEAWKVSHRLWNCDVPNDCHGCKEIPNCLQWERWVERGE